MEATPPAMNPACIVCGWAADVHERGARSHSFITDFTSLDAANSALRRVVAEVYDWPAADFWHRDAILRALGGCTCGDTFNPRCPEHGGNEHRP